MRHRRLWIGVLGTLASIGGSLVYAAWPGSWTFTVRPETTYVTEPLDKHGCVDYVTALNERLSKGITAENNANVLIWTALGPRPEGGDGMPPEFFQWLGIEPPPEQGDYQISWEKYLKEHGKTGPEIATNNDRFLHAVEWPWTAKHEPELADWLKRNEKPLGVILEATRRRQYFNPLVPKRTEDWSPGIMGSLVPGVQRCRDVASALACRAMLRVAEGRNEEAWQDLLACHRLGRLLSRGGSLIELLVGLALDTIADRGDLAFLDHAKLSSSQILACLEDLRKLPPMSGLADKLDLTERFTVLETMTMTARYGPSYLEDMASTRIKPRDGNRFTATLFQRSVNWDPALRNGNAWIDRYVAALRIADRAKRAQEVAAINQDLRMLRPQGSVTELIGKVLAGPERRGEMMGDIVIGLLLPAVDKVQGAAERIEQQERNLHLAFGLAAYRQDHGRYPERLDDLAPKYLAKVPADLFSNAPLVYRPDGEGYLLYSVGLNGIDEDGHGYDDDPRGDDLSVRMPVPPPRQKE